MIRDLRYLGTVLVAVLAMSSVAASAATAETAKLTSDGPVKLTGTTTSGIARAFGFTLVCHEHATVGAVNETPQGFVTPPLSTFTVQTESTGCIATIGAIEAPSTVVTNGCDGVTHLGETIAANKWGGTVDIVCPEGKQIEINSYTNASHTSLICKMKIPPQTGLKGGSAENLGEGKVGLSGFGEGIKATKTGILCGGNGETNSAEVTGTAVVTGTNESGKATAIEISE